MRPFSRYAGPPFNADSAETMQETAKATFQSRQAQINLRNYLQLRIIPCFRKSTLQSKSYVVLSCLQSVFKVTKLPNNVRFTGSKNKTVILPNVFGKGQMKLKVLPLEYASQNQPNPSKRRDFNNNNNLIIYQFI